MNKKPKIKKLFKTKCTGNVQDKTKTFKPTKAMMKFLEACLNPDSTGSYYGASRAAGLDKDIYWTWKKRYGEQFLNWFTDEFSKGINQAVVYLDMIGLQKARHSYAHWEAMQKKYGGLADKLKQEHSGSLTLQQLEELAE